MDEWDPSESAMLDAADNDAAEQAFEALRVEVADLGQRLEARLHQQAEAVAGAPDYSPTLGAMVQELTAIGQRLDTIEAHPALALTPAMQAQQIAAGIQQGKLQAERGLAQARCDVEETVAVLQRMIGTVHAQGVQRQRVQMAVAVGVVLGFVAWWPVTAILPWHAGHWLAATLIDGGGRWEAGAALMRADNPQAWSRMVRLYRACPPEMVTEDCEAAIAGRNSPAGSASPASSPPEPAKSSAPVAAAPPRSPPRNGR
jgi:hypothetical protein